MLKIWDLKNSVNSQPFPLCTDKYWELWDDWGGKEFKKTSIPMSQWRLPPSWGHSRAFWNWIPSWIILAVLPCRWQWCIPCRQGTWRRLRNTQTKPSCSWRSSKVRKKGVGIPGKSGKSHYLFLISTHPSASLSCKVKTKIKTLILRLGGGFGVQKSTFFVVFFFFFNGIWKIP